MFGNKKQKLTSNQSTSETPVQGLGYHLLDRVDDQNYKPRTKAGSKLSTDQVQTISRIGTPTKRYELGITEPPCTQRTKHPAYTASVDLDEVNLSLISQSDASFDAFKKNISVDLSECKDQEIVLGPDFKILEDWVEEDVILEEVTPPSQVCLFGLTEFGDGEFEEELKGDEEDKEEGFNGMNFIVDPVYADDVYVNMVKSEKLYIPSFDYIESQPWTWHDRRTILDHLYYIHTYTGMTCDILYATANLFDRICSSRQILTDDLELLGLTCIFIIAKFTNYPYLTSNDLLRFEHSQSYTPDHIVNCESLILEVVDYQLLYPSPLHILNSIITPNSSFDPIHKELTLMARYLMELTINHYQFISTQPSLLAASSLYLCRQILDFGDWSEELVRITAYEKKELNGTAKLLIHLLTKEDIDNKVDEKYSKEEFMGVATYARDWMRAKTKKYLKRSREE